MPNDQPPAEWMPITHCMGVETVAAWPTFLWPLLFNYIKTTEDARRFDCAHAGDQSRLWRWDSYSESEPPHGP